MRAELDGMKNITVCDAVVTLRSAANAAAEAQMDVLADELLAKSRIDPIKKNERLPSEKSPAGVRFVYAGGIAE